MKREKNKKEPNSYNKILPFLIVLATIFMGIGYASINSITSDIEGLILANTQDGIFITDVSYDSNSNADLDNSKINNYYQKMLSTRVVLSESNPGSFITYNVTVYNSTNEEYVFTGAIFDESFYTDDNKKYNSDIIFDITKKGEVLSPYERFTFQVTFKYNNNTPSQNILNSYLSFVFKKAYHVTYVNMDSSDYPTIVAAGENLNIDMSNSGFSSFKIKVNDVEITNYTYINKIITIPNVNGDISIEGMIDKYTVTFDTNINVSEYVDTIGFTIEERTEDDGDYYRASFNKTTGTYDEWYRISFPSYDYKVGSTYRVRIKTRVQSANLDAVELRHAAMDNDWGSEGRVYVEFDEDEIGVWKEQELTRTFNSDTILQQWVQYDVSPRVEIYTSNLKLSDTIKSRSFTFDYKDIYVGEITTKELDYGSNVGALPTPTREGYVFSGWYTDPVGGTKISSSTRVISGDVTYYAHWVSSSEKATITFDTNMNVSEYVSTNGFTIEEKTDSEGTYYTASFNKTTGTEDEWYNIIFEDYNYQTDATYKIRIKTRMQSGILDFAEIRHSAIDNDWGTNGRQYIQFTNDDIGVWNEYVLTRKFPTTTMEQGGQTYEVSPRIEIYTSNVTLAGGINNRSLTFDYRDVYVSEITTMEVTYGNKIGTLPTPTRDGYTFKGWYTEPVGGTRISSSTAVTETTTYYAQWASDKETLYTVSYINAEGNDYPTVIGENEILVVDMSDGSYESVIVKINDSEITNFMFENNILTIPNVNGNVSVECIIKPEIIKIFNKEYKVVTSKATLTDSSNNTNDASGLYKSTDTNDGSATYYFRGNVDNNYVKFAGHTWRIVRINEDGTIRLILQTGINSNTYYRYASIANVYGMSHTYYTNNSSSGGVKHTLETWYADNLSNYSNYIVTGDYFCEEAKVKANSAYISGDAVMTAYSDYTPNFKCATDGNGKGIVNSNIGLITYDELAHAGGYYNKDNKNYYLYNNSYFWTMSSAGTLHSGAPVPFVWYFRNGAIVTASSTTEAQYIYTTLRPVINIRADVGVTGTGMGYDPFVITTLKDKILADNTLITSNPTLTTSSNNTSDASGLYKSTDTNDGSATYYFRGNVENNYVDFAGFTWRIVRINEDGTIRLVLENGVNNRGYNFNSTVTGVDSIYYSNTNKENSARYVLNDWFNTNLSNYSSLIATGNYYCEQAKVRLVPALEAGNAEMQLSSSYTPNFKCATDGNGYGLVNSNIGLLNYDEIVHAGGFSGQANVDYFLKSDNNYWTMSPAGTVGGSTAYEWFVEATGNINYVVVADGFMLRPVINIKANAIVTGDGTIDNKYIIY